MIYVQGFTEKGNTTVLVGGLSSTNKVQGSFPSCTVTVYIIESAIKADLYSDNLSTPTPKANPFTASSDGTWGFFVAAGTYDIVFSGGGLAAPFTIPNVYAGNPGEFNIIDFGGRPDWNGSTGTNNVIAHEKAVAQAKAAGGGTIIYPQGNGGYWFDGDMETVQGGGIRFLMPGTHQYNLDAVVPTKSRIVFTDPNAGVRFTNCFGVNMQGFQVDGTDVCLNPIIFDRCYLGVCINTSVYRTSAAGVAITGTDTAGVPGTGMLWQRFLGLNVAHGGVGVYFTGIKPITGSFVNTIIGYSINFSGNAAVVFDESDNIGLYDGFCYRTSGTGVGYRFFKDTGYQVNNIWIQHTSVGGNNLPVPCWLIDPGIENPGVIWGIDESNGTSIPAIANGCNISIHTMGTNDAVGVRQTKHFRSGTVTLANVGTASEFWRDDQDGGRIVFSALNTTGFKEKWDHTGLEILTQINDDGTTMVDAMALAKNYLRIKGGLAPGTPAGVVQGNRIFVSQGIPSNSDGEDGDININALGTSGAKTIFWIKVLGVWVHAIA